jgi:hypothetical protein
MTAPSRFPFPVRLWLVLGGLFAFGCLMLWTVTRWGIGLSPDSTIYLAGARGLVEGQGMAYPFGGDRWYPITSWPPFYSILLALLSLPGLDPWVGARVLNAVLLGANAVLVALLLRRMLGNGIGIPALGGILFLLSADALMTHAWAWSDPLFLFLGFLGLLVLDRYLEGGHRRDLVGAGLLMGLCTYTRYIGAAFVLTALIVLAIRAVRSQVHKASVLDLVLFTTLACVPAAGWSLRNLGLSANLAGDIVTMRGIPPGDWQAVYQIVSLWFVPGRVPEPARSGVMLGLTALFFTLSFLALGRAKGTSPRGSVRLGRMILLFVLLYLGILIATRLSLRAFNFRDARYYLPVYLSLIVLWLYDLRWLYFRLAGGLPGEESRRTNTVVPIVAQSGLAAVFLFVVSLHGVQLMKWARESYSEGMGYANASWHSSRMLEYVRSLPKETPVLSNAFDAILALTGRQVYPFPRSIEEGAIPTGLTSEEEWARTKALLEIDETIVAAFHRSTRKGQVRVREILREVPLCAYEEYEEGTIYGSCAVE